MAQVQDERPRLAGAYERALAIVALMSLPLGTFLWVVAPELIPVVLGPAWGDVVLPFRLFTVSLLFRMSSKISDACTKAAGAVYRRALIQFAYAALVVAGAIVGQRWGVGGVAVCVSIAMGINWLNMAQLGRSVTGLAWTGFARAHAPAVLLALVSGTAALLAAEAARGAHLGKLSILVAAALVAAVAAYGAAQLRPALFLGPHGTWARQEGEALLRRGARRGGGAAAADGETLAPVGEAGST
jgi:PST family polysaccharide transporter